MKTKHPHITKTPALLLAVLTLAAGAAAAQTTVFYSNTGSGSNAAAGGATSAGNLASIGFDSSQWNATSGAVDTTSGTIGARVAAFPVAALYQNYTATGLPTTFAGQTLENVTLYLFAESVNPNGTSPTYTLYDGLNGTGGAIGGLTLNGDTADGSFFSVTVTAAQFLNGFSIGATMANGALNVSTENNLTAFQTPGLSATYNAVPEPSIGILGAVGALGLLRRRRA